MTETATKPTFEQWAILELMGHVRLAGLVTEQELFGQKLGRIEIPQASDPACPNCGGKNPPCPVCEGGTFTTQFFSGGSIYRLTPTTEAIARSVASHSQTRPVSEWELRPALPAPSREERECKGCGFVIEECDCEPEDDEEF